jgi:hypothetical protein
MSTRGLDFQTWESTKATDANIIWNVCLSSTIATSAFWNGKQANVRFQHRLGPSCGFRSICRQSFPMPNLRPGNRPDLLPPTEEGFALWGGLLLCRRAGIGLFDFVFQPLKEQDVGAVQAAFLLAAPDGALEFSVGLDCVDP